MALPRFETLMRPILVILEDGRPRHSSEIRAQLAAEFSLTREDLAERLPRAPLTRFVNLTAWAFHHLSRACLVEREGPSIYRIIERGRRVLEAHPTSVDIAVCRQFDEWHHSRSRRAERRRSANPSAHLPHLAASSDPRIRR